MPLRDSPRGQPRGESRWVVRAAAPASTINHSDEFTFTVALTAKRGLRIMLTRSRLLLATFVAVTLSLAFAAAASAAGGTITGTVTDPKGAVVVGATVTVTDAAGAQVHAPIKTDAQGRYKIEGLPAGTYVVAVNAVGFKEAKREQLVVEDGKSVAADLQLEVALVGESVVVKGSGVKPNEDPVYRQLREQAESAIDGVFVRLNAAAFDD